MALIVEDGTVVAGAESYITVADASAMHTSLGNAAWAALTSDTIREQCLRKATSYMEGQYRQRWAGYRKLTTQALDWPRSFVPLSDAYYAGQYVSDTSVPNEVKFACAELALKASTGDLLADLSQQVIRKKVASIEIEYDKYSSQSKRYPAIEAMLSPYFNSASSVNHELIR